MLDICLASTEISEYCLSKFIGLNEIPFKYHSAFEKQELHNILIEYQDNFGFVCFKKLFVSQDRKDLDHELFVHDLREMSWLELTKLVLGTSNKND